MDKKTITNEMSKLSELLNKLEQLKEINIQRTEVKRARPYLKQEYYKRRLDGLKKKERRLELSINA